MIDVYAYALTFTAPHVGLTTRYRRENVYKSIFVLSSLHHIQFVKWIESFTLQAWNLSFKI